MSIRCSPRSAIQIYRLSRVLSWVPSIQNLFGLLRGVDMPRSLAKGLTRFSHRPRSTSYESLGRELISGIFRLVFPCPSHWYRSNLLESSWYRRMATMCVGMREKGKGRYKSTLTNLVLVSYVPRCFSASPAWPVQPWFIIPGKPQSRTRPKLGFEWNLKETMAHSAEHHVLFTRGSLGPFLEECNVAIPVPWSSLNDSLSFEYMSMFSGNVFDLTIYDMTTRMNVF